ncbi:MAG TPA: DNA gyrase subunit A [Longimicrobium sp.]|jgi:DNA gyrase subunit A|uniref:DNA gyrase subunit A n=1 Tax=Longimicrobium sp. TaxID=2029185 RepID=UPI002EDA14AF
MAILTPTQRDRIVPRLIEDEMRESFIDYSMSVIVQRALPDVRDGLKPVHRRILFAMSEAGLIPTRPYKKSATVVGDVLGKYHPHGDASVYDSLVRMVQDFSLRYPLVDGQGNFGSIDGDAAAAYRYTESRLSSVAMEMLADIDRDTVDFAPNYDDRLTEPRVLPSRVPNLLVNGSSGIAVGMSTNMPPHNLGEVVRAAVHLLDHPECTLDDLMTHLPGPDFPTGGLIVGTQGIRDAYAKGRGRVVMRARVYKESRRNGKEQLVVTEIPYGTNKSRIIEQIAELTRSGKLQDISDLRDESDRDGIRIVIELKRGSDPAKVLTGLFKWTALQTTFGVISLALDRGVPREFTLLEILERFRDHRIQVVVRRSRWELDRARDEAHVLAGMMIALRRIDEVIAIIRGSRNRETAARKLEKELKLTERQSEAILSMRLSRLTQLESRELRERLAELEARIKELEALLASPEAQVAVVRAELLEMRERFGDGRRTTIFADEKSVRIEDMLAAEEVVVTLTREGFVKQIPMPVYQRAAQTGRGLIGTEYEADFLERVLVASTEDALLVFSTDGRAYALEVRDLPEPELRARGKRLHQLLEFARNADIAAVHVVREFAAERMVLFATAGGTVKRTSLDQFGRIRAGGIEAISLRAGDRLVSVAVTDGEMEVVLAGRGGRAIRFGEGDVPVMGRATQGVRGMKLDGRETLAGMAAGKPGLELAAVTVRGQAKRFAMDDLPLQKRDGKGVIIAPGGKEFGDLVALLPLAGDLNAVMADGAPRRIRRDSVPLLPRDARPEAVLELARGEKIVLVTPLAERDADAPGSPDDIPPPPDAPERGPDTSPDSDAAAPPGDLDTDAAERGSATADGGISPDTERTDADAARPLQTPEDGATADTDAVSDADGASASSPDAEQTSVPLVVAAELFADEVPVADDEMIIEDPIAPPPDRKRRGTREAPSVADVGPKATRDVPPAPPAAPASAPAPVDSGVAPTPAPRRARKAPTGVDASSAPATRGADAAQAPAPEAGADTEAQPARKARGRAASAEPRSTREPAPAPESAPVPEPAPDARAAASKSRGRAKVAQPAAPSVPHAPSASPPSAPADAADAPEKTRGRGRARPAPEPDPGPPEAETLAAPKPRGRGKAAAQPALEPDPSPEPPKRGKKVADELDLFG